MKVDLQPDATFTLPDPELHHLTNVLRAEPGDTFEVVGDDGTVYRASLREGGEAVISGRAGEDVGEMETARVVLYQAVPKGKRMDLVVEKATELGVAGIVPVLTDRSVARPAEGGKLERWRRIAESAARQSLRRTVPQIESPVIFRRVVGSVRGAVLLHNGAGLPALEEAINGDEVGLFVGPEGGWSEGEIDLVRGLGIPLASIGGNRLRSETAGIAAVVRAALELDRIKEKRGST